MTPAELADLYALAFPEASGWKAGDFQDILSAPGTILCTLPGAFALGRVAADEAELLLIATAPEHRRKGLGARCLAAFHAEAERRGARTAFLEVAESNRAARAMYTNAGYRKVGRRKEYYAQARGMPQTALILRRALA